MAKRKFELPGIHELSKEQEKAIRLPMEGRHLIVGGPGTGKTVVTLLRLRRHLGQSNGRKSVFLVYNRMLLEAARQLYGEEMTSATWQSWFMRLFSQTLGQQVPTQQTDSGYNAIDWQAVSDAVLNKEKDDVNEIPFVFIDEGQDMPPGFYQSLIRLGFEKFYVVADQNQAITEKNSSRQCIQNALVINPDEVVELTQNYRNAFPVARLASQFYPDDPATAPLELPPHGVSAQTPFLIEYGPGSRLTFESVIGRLLKFADRDPRKLIGILSPKNHVRVRYLDALRQQAASGEISLDNGIPRIQTYAAGENTDIRFDEGGILVINAQSCKGLEFDTVFIADIHEFVCHPGITDEKKRLFYVMTARARERVFFLRESGKPCPVDCILPKDPQVLKTWR
jgi:DNA helicase II / ATP-dependent DNA helicase PcrA